MARNIVAAQVNTSIMEGTEATYSVDIRDYLGDEVDLSLVTLRCTVDGVSDFALSWDAELGVHALTFPEMREGRYSFEIYLIQETGEHVVMVQGWLGVFASDSWQEPVLSTDSPNRTLRIRLGDKKGQIEATWLATAAAEGFAYKAQKWAKALKDAMPLLESAKAFMESFDEALKKAIQIRGNYLWIGGVNTGHKVKGEDGQTPSYNADDGYLYLGEQRIAKIKGEAGLTTRITADGYWAIGNKVYNVKAAGRDGIDGTAIRRVLIASVSELPNQREQGVFYYIKIAEKLYDVYAWLDPDGWVNIKEDSSFATAEDYGIMKYGTDIPVLDGAPLGRSETGHAYTGYATYYEPGVGKLSSALVVAREESAPVALNEDGQFCVYKASIALTGCVSLSYFGKEALNDLLGGPIGRNENGNIYAAPATEGKWGAVKGGKRYTVTVPEPYVRKTGETPEREMANYALFGGALQTRKAAAWRGTMSWLDEQMQLHSEYFAGEGDYDGLLHSEQFTQSWGNGLELLPATTKLLAGVYLAESMSDTRSAAVVQPAILVNYLSEHYYGKSQVYTKQETLTQLQSKLNGYVTLTWAQDNLMTRTQIMDELRKKIGCPSGKIANFEAIPASERGEMSAVDAKTFTIVYAG